MIIWKGFGILNIIIPGILFVIVGSLVSALGLDSIDSRYANGFCVHCVGSYYLVFGESTQLRLGQSAS